MWVCITIISGWSGGGAGLTQGKTPFTGGSPITGSNPVLTTNLKFTTKNKGMATIYKVEVTSHWISYSKEELEKILTEAVKKIEFEKGNTIQIRVEDKK